MTNQPYTAFDDELIAFQTRVLRRRRSHQQSTRLPPAFTAAIARCTRWRPLRLHVISARYVLHLLVGILVPLAILVDHIPLEPNPVNTAVNIPIFSGSGDFLAPLVPLSLIHEETGVTPVPDSAFAAIDALPITTLRPEMLAPPPLAAIV